MKNFKVMVNGKSYDVSVEEVEASAVVKTDEEPQVLQPVSETPVSTE